MPPDFIYALPHAGMFLVILAVVGSIAFALHISVARWPLRGISPAGSAIAVRSMPGCDPCG